MLKEGELVRIRESTLKWASDKRLVANHGYLWLYDGYELPVSAGHARLHYFKSLATGRYTTWDTHQVERANEEG